MLLKGHRLMQSSIKWSMKTTKCSGLIRWNKNRANKTWFFHIMKRRLFSRDKRNLRSTKRNSSEGTLSNKVRELRNFKPWNRLLKLREKLSSIDLLKKKPPEELSKSMSKILETTSRFKKWKREPVKLREMPPIRDKCKRRSSRWPRTTN